MDEGDAVLDCLPEESIFVFDARFEYEAPKFFDFESLESASSDHWFRSHHPFGFLSMSLPLQCA